MCNLLHLYFLAICILSFCILSCLYFINFAFFSSLYFVLFVFWCCILFCLYYGIFVSCHRFVSYDNWRNKFQHPNLKGKAAEPIQQVCLPFLSWSFNLTLLNFCLQLLKSSSHFSKPRQTYQINQWIFQISLNSIIFLKKWRGSFNN